MLSSLVMGFAHARRDGAPLMRYAPIALLTLGCLAAWFVFARKPFIHDLAPMHFVAWRISEGDIPYRDIWDMNGPGTYLVHLALLSLPFSYSTVSAAGMTGLVAACTFAAYGAAAKDGRPVLGLMFGFAQLLWLTGRGEALAMQRDLMIAACAAGALFLFTGALDRMWRWVVGGLLIGFAVGIKPTAAPFALAALAGAVWLDAAGASRFKRAIGLTAGGAIGGCIWFSLLVATGSVGDWWSGMTTLNVDYVTSGRASVLGLLPKPDVVFAIFAALLCVGAAFVTAKFRWGDQRTVVGLTLASSFVAIGVVMFLIQGKGWVYQFAPAGVLGIMALGAAANAFQVSRPIFVIPVCLVALVHVGGAFAGIRDQLSDTYAAIYAGRVQFVERMAAALRELPPGMKVQSLDTTDGAAHAMLLARRAPASPVGGDFMLFQGSQTGRTNARNVVFGTLRKTNAAILLTNQGWPDRMDEGFARMDEVEEFRAILQDRYVLKSEGAVGRYKYRLYAPVR